LTYSAVREAIPAQTLANQTVLAEFYTGGILVCVIYETPFRQIFNLVDLLFVNAKNLII
jgi:hypothetical protein